MAHYSPAPAATARCGSGGRWTGWRSRTSDSAGRRERAVGDGTVRLWGALAGVAVSHLRLGGPVRAVAWGPSGIAVAASAAVVLLDVVGSTDGGGHWSG